MASLLLITSQDQDVQGTIELTQDDHPFWTSFIKLTMWILCLKANNYDGNEFLGFSRLCGKTLKLVSVVISSYNNYPILQDAQKKNVKECFITSHEKRKG